MDFNQILQKINEEKAEQYVKIKGTKNAYGEDLYDVYGRWFDDYFPKGTPITGIIWGKAISDITDENARIVVTFAIIKDGKVVKRSGHKNSFKTGQLEDL